jgi:hypothetical protein
MISWNFIRKHVPIYQNIVRVIKDRGWGMGVSSTPLRGI